MLGISLLDANTSYRESNRLRSAQLRDTTCHVNAIPERYSLYFVNNKYELHCMLIIKLGKFKIHGFQISFEDQREIHSKTEPC